MALGIAYSLTAFYTCTVYFSLALFSGFTRPAYPKYFVAEMAFPWGLCNTPAKHEVHWINGKNCKSQTADIQTGRFLTFY